MSWIASTSLFIVFFAGMVRMHSHGRHGGHAGGRGPSERSDPVGTVGEDDGGHCGIGKPSPVATARGEDLVGSVGSSGRPNGVL